MRRRALVIAGVVLALAAAGTPIDAQQAPRIVRIGFLSPTTLAATTHTVEAFRQALRELGYAEGKNLVLEVRHADASVERLPELARELVGLKMDAIVTISNDPVGTGFVASLARPGGNITGLCNISPELSGKRLELLREVVPGLSRVAFLWNPESRSVVLDYKETESAARSLRLELQSLEVSRVEDLDRALSALTDRRVQALVMPRSHVLRAQSCQA